MTHLMYSCRKATELLDKKCFERLNSLEQIKLFMHTRMCDACKAYEKQTTLVHKALRREINPDPFPSERISTFTQHVKETIKD